MAVTQADWRVLEEVVWARVPGTRLLRGKNEVNWLELVWLGKTESTQKHLCGDEHGVRKFRTNRRQHESARWRRELVDRLTGEPFNPKPHSATVMDGGKLPVDLQWSERYSPNVNIDEAPKDEVPEVPGPAATQKRWYVTEALVNEYGRTMGCPRCSSGIDIHNARCRGRIEEILLRQSRMKWKQEEEPRGGQTTTKLVPMESEKPTGPATQHRGSTTTGLISCDAGEHCLVSLRAGNKRQRWRTEMKSLQSSLGTGESRFDFICGLDNERHGDSREDSGTVWFAFALGEIVVEEDLCCYMG